MKNKIEFKKCLKKIFIFLAFATFLFFLVLFLQYKELIKTTNYKLNSILVELKEKYPNLSEKEIMTILNIDDKPEESFVKKFGIDLNEESIIPRNEALYFKYMVIDIVLFIVIVFIVIYLFINYNHKKDREIAHITNLIEEINHRNYTLDIDNISEDELSFLKNEIYKTTIMLKEQANNSLKDKLDLKNSLQDISHQLKTPLTSILIMLDNILDDKNMDNNTKEDFLREIKKDIMNINFLIQNILKLSKLDSNTVHFIEEEISVEKIIDGAIRNVSSLSDLRSVTICKKISVKKKIVCDFKWQTEAITNILKNAIEHSPLNSRVIITSEENKVYTIISIKDEGKGIPNEELPHIFERFYKGTNSTKDSIGIGLPLAKTIIESANGTISVDSNSSGTEFKIKYFYRSR